MEVSGTELGGSGLRRHRFEEPPMAASKLPSCLFAGLALLLGSNVQAKFDEAAIRETLARLAPQATIERLRDSAMPGLVEAVVDGQIVYVSSDGRHLLQGALVDGSNGRDLTEAARISLRAAALEALPAAARIRFVPERPQRQVVVFTAVDCGYCRRFHQAIDALLADGTAVDYVLTPLGGAGSAADRSSREVYCAADRQAAFTAATFGQPLPASPASADPACGAGYEQGLAAARALGIGQTPTILAPDGRLLGGYLTPDELRQRLATP